MTAVGDFFQIRASGEHLGQSFENVWWYNISTVASSGNRMSAFLTRFATMLLPLQTYVVDSMEINLLVAQNWKQSAESASTASAFVGAVATASMPTWLTYTVSWNRLGAGYNYPMKRIPGVPEALTDGNDILNDTRSALLAWAYDMLTINTGVGDLAQMIAFKKTPPLGVSDPSPTIYRPQIPTTSRAVKLGTQKTRK